MCQLLKLKPNFSINCSRRLLLLRMVLGNRRRQEKRKVLKTLLSIASSTWNGPIQFHFLAAFFLYYPQSTEQMVKAKRFSCVVSCKIRRRKLFFLHIWPSCVKSDYFWMIYHLVFILQWHSISLFYFARTLKIFLESPVILDSTPRSFGPLSLRFR